MSRFIWLIVLVAALVLLPKICHAVQPDEIMSDPKLEARARLLSQQLRCMVCQNQSIDDSDAPLARDLRLLVRERIAHGDSDRQVMDFLVARYGPFVLLKPPLNPHTMLLWFLPPLALAGGAIAMVLYARRRGNRTSPVYQNDAAPLTSEERAELARIMGRERPGSDRR
jgi:cytochrome c-type biogenesis protein CcmH